MLIYVIENEICNLAEFFMALNGRSRGQVAQASISNELETQNWEGG